MEYRDELRKEKEDRRKMRRKDAARVAGFIARGLNIPVNPERQRIGVILGAGLSDVLDMEQRRSFPLVPEGDWEKPGLQDFDGLKSLDGHKREMVYGRLGEVEVLELDGRLHMNEMVERPEHAPKVLLQLEAMAELGVRKFILTSSAVGIRTWTVKAGDIVVADSFTLGLGPNIPLDPEEQQKPWLLLDSAMRKVALEVGGKVGLTMHEGGFAMMRGPLGKLSEGDMFLFRVTRALAGVTSTIPEACAVIRYPHIKGVALARISDDGNALSSSEEKRKFGALLMGTIGGITQLP